jgi:hypothetical protein
MTEENLASLDLLDRAVTQTRDIVAAADAPAGDRLAAADAPAGDRLAAFFGRDLAAWP